MSSNNEFIWSLKNGDLDRVRDFVEVQNLDVNAPLEGRPPIHYASDFGQKDVILYLISKGADVNAVDRHGIPALLPAIWEGHTDCVKILIQSGAEKEGRTPDGKTFLDATERDDIRMLLRT
jgi:ankyrin repeat protein